MSYTYGRTIFNNGRSISTRGTINNIYKHPEIQIIKSPFNSNRQCLFKPYNDSELIDPAIKFINYKNIDDYFTLHFQFRYEKSPRWIDGFYISYISEDGSEKYTSFRLKEDYNFGGAGWYNEQYMGIYLDANKNYDCACILKDGVLKPYIDGVHYNDYYEKNIKRITQVKLVLYNTSATSYNHYSDLYYDDIFCCFGRSLIEDGYTPDYDNYFMLDKFNNYKIYDEIKNQYAY